MLNFPLKLPRFCTDNPSGITEPSEDDKDDGFQLAAYVSSTWFNWMQNLNYQWHQALSKAILGDFRLFQISDFSAVTAGEIVIYHPILKLWLFYSEDLDQVVLNDTEFSFASAVATTGATFGAVHNGAKAYDSSRFIISSYTSLTNQIVYSSNGTSWTAKDTGYDHQIYCFGIKRPYANNDFIVAGFSDGAIRYASSVSGTYSAPSTPPPLSSSVRAIKYMDNSNWILLRADGLTYISDDDCDTWTITDNTPNSTGLINSGCNSLDYNPSKGTVIVISQDDEKIARSPNGGTDWESVTIELSGRVLGGLKQVKYIGGENWIAIGNGITHFAGPDYPGILISVDDGKTWTLPACPIDANDNGVDCGSSYYFSDLDCNDRYLILFHRRNGHIFISNALVGIEDYGA